jgi:cytochrome c biogenesis protein
MTTVLSGATRTVTKPVRTAWRRLTSMRTALILLFLLAVGAVPGSLLPQRPLNPQKTTAYIKDHGGWGRFLDRIGMFDVFGSVWFAAIYLLLFISLIGCLIPRIRVHARAMVRKPLAAPRVLSKLPESGSFEIAQPASDYAAVARSALGRRWRIAQRTEDSGAITLSAEKGYSRETGNLIFHIALLVSLVLIAVGRLYSYQGSAIVEQGDGMCNSVTSYDSWTPGRFAAEGKVHPAPFCINDLTKFTATYTSSGEPSEFAADVNYSPDLRSSATKTATIKVNHPLRLEGDRVYLTGHGFAPTITITKPDGTKLTRIADFLPTVASTLYSEGVFSIPGKAGANQDIGISGSFSPTPVLDSTGAYESSSPQVKNPVLGLIYYTGDLNRDGQSKSVYSIDTSKMKKVGMLNLRIGQTKTLANGTKITFDKWTPWANLQVSHDPAQGYLLFSALAMVLGLAASLGVRRRRVWVRIAPDGELPGGPHTLVRVGGLARSDSGNFTTEFDGLLARLRDAGSPMGGPSGLHDSLDPIDHSISAGKD